MTEDRIRFGRLHNGGFEARIEGRGIDGDIVLIADKDFRSVMVRLWSALAARLKLTPQEARVTAPTLPPAEPALTHSAPNQIGTGCLKQLAHRDQPYMDWLKAYLRYEYGDRADPTPAPRSLWVAWVHPKQHITLPPDARIVSIEWITDQGTLMAAVAYEVPEATEENAR